MQYFSPFPQNPVVPSYYSYVLIDSNTVTNYVELIFPASFTPIRSPQDETVSVFEMASLIQYVNTGVNANVNMFLPDATLGAPGNGTLIYNTTANAFDVLAFGAGGAVASIGAGQQWLIYLTDNSTSAGQWLAIQCGAGTSQSNAAALAGNGLLALNSKLNVITSVQDYATLPVSFTNTDGYKLFNYTGGTASWMLPTAPFVGFTFYLKNSTNNNGILTIVPQGINNIDGQSSISISYNQSLYLVSDGANWLTFGLNNNVSSAVQFSTAGIKVINGLASAPSYSFINFPNTGIYTSGSDNISFSSNGNDIAEISSFGLNVVSGQFYLGELPLLYLAGIYP